MTPQEQNDIESNVEKLASSQSVEKKPETHPNLSDLEEFLKINFPSFFNFTPLIAGMETQSNPIGKAVEDKGIQIPADEIGTFGPEVSTTMINAVSSAAIAINKIARSHVGIVPSDISLINSAIVSQAEKVQALLPTIKTEKERGEVERMCKQRVRLNGDKFEIYEI